MEVAIGYGIYSWIVTWLWSECVVVPPRSLDSLQSHVERSLEKQRDSLGALEIRNQELEHKMEKENIRIFGEITETTDELARKVLQREIKQDEEWQAKYSQLEKVNAAESDLLLSSP